jgi:diketogulonate reductase-like aldo/keto reductase
MIWPWHFSLGYLPLFAGAKEIGGAAPAQFWMRWIMTDIISVVPASTTFLVTRCNHCDFNV